MNAHKKAICEWATEMKNVWNEYGPQIEGRVSYDKIKLFVNSLAALLEECNLGENVENEVRDDDLSELASDVFEKWNDLELARMNGGEIRINPVPIGGHTLPPLPYAYNALEPYISEEIMRLHHDKHHQSYVDGLNKAETEMQKARNRNDYDLIKHWEREAAFHGAGHYLHSIFWEIMSLRGGGEPSGEIGTQIRQDFGSFRKMKGHFSAAAEKVEGGGWALLVWSPRSHRLEILQAEKHQNLSQQDVIPLLVLDVWEHAYYLQYKNERKPYIDNWWNIVNWPAVENRFLHARQLRWQPY
ncbi:superoxide dismutase [Halalkalibacter nanhaiisediminis]|uniref:superoxide dismutase n=1 Tax=Halalkalibacter nanhaiisediminis TaxID=688079 RepID=A0A562QF42_9BACI|nr:superoxide dismutase [Halalkalibacter nanhaiisediminis]TWI54656.1 Fe-Mn family superoxide dismutase [Halalkalibacter nanhaiisediminis]